MDYLAIFLALTPVFLLIILLGFLKISGDKSALYTLIVTIFLAAFGFKFSTSSIGLSIVYGTLKAIFPIILIIIMAIYSYNVLVYTKKMEVLKFQFSNISTDKSIQVLLLTWGFGGLLEGMAGFGTAVAIPAAILIGLGYKPLFSALVSLLSNSVPTAFGAVGIPVKAIAIEIGHTDLQHLGSRSRIPIISPNDNYSIPYCISNGFQFKIITQKYCFKFGCWSGIDCRTILSRLSISV